jgi:urease accessory protein
MDTVTAMITHTTKAPVAETSSADLMALTQWLSPAFPVSAYAYSHGLEAAISSGAVTDAASVEAWIATVLEAGSGRTDAILLAAALAPASDLEALSDVARALASSAERWEETRAQGAAFAATHRAMGADQPDRPYPLAVAEAARALHVPRETVVALYLQAFAGALVSVAVRFVPLGQAEGQRLLARLQPRAEAVAREAVAVPPEDVIGSLGGAAFGADLAAMEHEMQEVRLFRT